VSEVDVSCLCPWTENIEQNITPKGIITIKNKNGM